jgi:exosortase O
MNENTHGTLSHEQARRYLLAAADGLLGESERANLQRHLRHCEACRAESNQLDALHRDLRRSFRDHWDAVPSPAAPLVTELPQAEPLLPRLGRTTLNAVLLALWAWLYWAVFGYLKVIFSREEFRTNQFVLAIVLVLIFVQFRQQRIRPRFDALPQIYLPGLAFALGGSVLYLLAERFLDINTLSATLFGLASYGLLGLWMSPRRWQEGLPAALLLIGTLPFGDHLQTFVGYPMRIATATIVQNALQAVGIHSVGVDTILVLESGLAQVDLPCSGIKSLWTGMLFLTAATWIERRAINLRWLGIAGLFGGLLFATNVARVATLVLVGQVAGWKMMAELIHVPLGVLAFVGVCGIALLLIRWQPSLSYIPSASVKPVNEQSGTFPVKRPLWLAPVLAVVFAGMALLYTPRSQTATAQAGVEWVFPPELRVQVNPMSPELYAWATSDGADFADRWFFEWQAEHFRMNGSLLYLTSSTWRGQHAPERCFEVDGFTVEASQTVLFADDFPARLVLLRRGGTQVSALYWLQAADKVTDDFATRIWSDLSPDRQRWVLVTVLLDDVYSPDNAAVQSLAHTLRRAVAASLEGERP